MANPGLIPNMVPEIIRLPNTTGLHAAHHDPGRAVGRQVDPRRGSRVDVVCLWKPRQPAVIDQADRFWIDRPKARQQLSFGFGIHRCMGNRSG